MHRNVLRALFVVVSVGILNCGTTDPVEPTVDSYVITPANATTTIGGSVSYTLTANWSDGQSNVVDNVVWTSTSEAVASMAGAVATGVSAGVTLISAISGSWSGSATLTVIDPPASIAISPASHDAIVTETVSYTATATSTSGATSDVTATVTWGSTIPAVATIVAGGTATAVGEGLTSITATLGAVSDTALLNVTDPVVEIDIFPPGYSAVVGDVVPFSATGVTAGGQTPNVTGTATWTSTNPAVATMAANEATALSAGQTSIIATIGAVSDTVTLTVTAPPAPSITVTPADTTVAVGDSVLYKATDETGADITSSVTWTSSNLAVAGNPTSVGKALAVGPGQTKIIATLGALADSATLTVTAPPTGTQTGFVIAALGASTFDFGCIDNATGAFAGPVTQFTASGGIYQMWYMTTLDLVVAHTTAGFDAYRPGVGCNLNSLASTPVAQSAENGDAAVWPGTGTVAFSNLFVDNLINVWQWLADGTATPLPGIPVSGLSADGRPGTVAWVINPGAFPKIIMKFGNGLAGGVGEGGSASGPPWTVSEDNVTTAPQSTRFINLPWNTRRFIALGTEARTFELPANQPVPQGAAAVAAWNPRNVEFDDRRRCVLGNPGTGSGSTYQFTILIGDEVASSTSSVTVPGMATLFSFATIPGAANRTFAFGQRSGGAWVATAQTIDFDCRMTEVGTGVSLTITGANPQPEARAAFPMH